MATLLDKWFLKIDRLSKLLTIYFVNRLKLPAQEKSNPTIVMLWTRLYPSTPAGDVMKPLDQRDSTRQIVSLWVGAAWGLETERARRVDTAAQKSSGLDSLDTCKLSLCDAISSHVQRPQQWLQYLGTMAMSWIVKTWLISRSCLVATTWGMNSNNPLQT